MLDKLELMCYTSFMDIHIIPSSDAEEHITDIECPCCPDVKYVNGETAIYIHYPFDGRETPVALVDDLVREMNYLY